MNRKSFLIYRWLIVVSLFLTGVALSLPSFKSLALAANCEKGVIVDSACDFVEHIKLGEMSQEMISFGIGWALICSSIGAPIIVYLEGRFDKQHEP